MIFTPLAEKLRKIVFDGLLYQHHHCVDTSIMIHDPLMWLCFLKPPKCIVIAHQSSISSSLLLELLIVLE